jgi:hypothetical protein
VDRAEATLLAEYPDLDLGRDLAPPAAIWPAERFRLRHGMVTALDQVLAGIASRATGLPADAQLLAVSPDLRLVAAAVSDGLVVLGEEEWRLPVPGVDSAVILGSGQLLVPARVIATGGMFASANRVLLLDLAAREILDEVSLALNDAYICAIAHPQDGSVLLEAGMGQDGSVLFSARVTARKLTVSAVLENVVPGGFDPAGDRLLLVPHVSYGEDAFVVTWPGLARIAAVTPDGIGLDGDEFDYYGCFLGEDRVLGRVLCRVIS